MADTDTDERQDHEHAAGGSALTRKWHGAPVWAWTLGGTIAVVVVVRWWRNRGSSSAGSSSTGTGTATANCYDITGALVPCAQAAANNASGAGDLGGTLGGILTGTTATGTSTGTGTGTGTTATGTTTSTSTSTGTPTSGRLLPPVITGLSIKGKTGVRVNWTPVPGASGYVAQCKKGGNNGQSVNGPFDVPASQQFANFGGLEAGTKYTALVWPSSSQIKGGPGTDQPHAEYGFTTNK